MMYSSSLKFYNLRTIIPFLTSKRNKFIVLLPEIPPDTNENNPLLCFDKLPKFSQFTAEKCVYAIGKLVIDHEAGIHQIDQNLYDPSFQKNVQTLILPLERLSSPLEFAWGAFKLLYNVRHNDSIANAYMKCHSRLMQAQRERYFSLSLYQAFKELKAQKNLTQPIQRIVDKHLLESRLSGIDLSDYNYKHYLNLTTKLDKHRNNYKKNLVNSTSKFSHDLNSKDIKEFPREILKMFATDVTKPTNGPWKLTLEPHKYTAFLEYCDNRLLRWNAWFAYNIRATSLSGSELNNSLEIEEIQHIRNEMAKLLGYKTFSELSMETKMAGCVENVMDMITTLHIKSQPSLLNEIQELEAFANEKGFSGKLELWDIPYWKRVYKQELFNIDEALVRQYFPFPIVLKKLFAFFHSLFGITIQECNENIDKWHEDVSFYKIFDENNKEVAAFYLDPYLRSEKIQHSLVEIGRNRSDVTGSQPLSYVIFNFHPPTFGKPSLLSFEELKILMKKFGHVLQHSLTTMPYREVSGLTNLEWDVVNVCPNVFSLFLKNYHVVSKLSSHVQSEEPITSELHEKLIKDDEYMINFELTNELFRSALDLEIYTKKEYWLNCTKRVWAQYMPFPYEKNIAPTCSFPEIFSDYYPAAYFSNLWAEMIAADIFSAFNEVGFNNKEGIHQIGQRFRETFLALGGGSHPSETFRKFRGRDPCTDAFLSNYNQTKNEHFKDSQ